MNDLSKARCKGMWWLFDSTDPRDHAEAAKLCRECPAILACDALLRAEATAPLAAYGGPVGTWAGKLFGRNSGRLKPREHGSERGYQQHRHRHEEQCELCRLAHRANLKDYWRRSRMVETQTCEQRLHSSGDTADNRPMDNGAVA